MASKSLQDDLDSFLNYGVHRGLRTIYIGSVGTTDGDENGTDFAMAESAIKSLYTLDAYSSDVIKIISNNPGGCVYSGLAIFDAIKGCRSQILFVGTGHVMSMGSMIIQAADRRIMTPNATMMIHYGQFGVSDHPKIVYKWVDEGKRLDRLMEDTYLERIQVKHPKFTRKKLQEMLSFDTILTAQQAVDLGLADEVGYGK